MTARAPDDIDADRLNAQGRHADAVDASRRRYQRLRSEGLCTRSEAHGPAENGGSLCAPCMVDARIDRQASYRRHRQVSRINSCTRCGGTDGHNARSCLGDPLPEWRPTDARRLERQRIYRARRREQGVCINSPAHERPTSGRLRCDACEARRRKAKR